MDDVPEQRGIGSWNMAIPEVKEHKLSYIREACLQADWDGVELDWQRHPFHVPENYGYRLRYALTDLQRAVRRMADDIAEQRGRPFYVAARVATTLESCRNIGYDVERWAEEGLADIIIGAGGSGTDPGFEVGEFKALTEGTNIRLYGGFDSISGSSPSGSCRTTNGATPGFEPRRPDTTIRARTGCTRSTGSPARSRGAAC